jgi:hypothetical protein
MLHNFVRWVVCPQQGSKPTEQTQGHAAIHSSFYQMCFVVFICVIPSLLHSHCRNASSNLECVVVSDWLATINSTKH